MYLIIGLETFLLFLEWLRQVGKLEIDDSFKNVLRENYKKEETIFYFIIVHILK